MIRRHIGSAVTALVLCTTVLSLPAAAQPPDEDAYFTGKTITYLTASAPGSDTDRFDHVLAAEMQKALATTIVVRNVGDHPRDSALARVAAAPADGLIIAAFSGAAIYDQLTGQTPVDLRRLSWVGGAAGDPHVLVVPAVSPIRSVKDLRQPGDAFVVGVSRVASASYIESRMLKAALNLNMRVVAGFRSGDDVRAISNGTIDVLFGPECLYRELIDDGAARVVLRFGSADTADLAVAKLLREPGDASREVVTLLQSVAALGTVTAAPPGVPARRLQALRTMYRQAMESDAVRAASPGPLAAVGGRDVGRAVSDALHPGPHAAALIRDTFDVEPAPVLADAPTSQPRDRPLVSFVGFTR